MADEKKKKKKSKKEEAPAEAAPAPEPEAPAPEPVKKASTKASTKQASRGGGSNVFSMFSEKQIAEFKEGFQVMDADKDGVIGKNDLRATFDMVGRIASNEELEEYLAEAPGPLSFTQLLQMFGERMSGGGEGTDDDDVVIDAFNAFDEGDGKCSAEDLRHALKTWGDKYTDKECDSIFGELPIDSFDKIDIKGVVTMLTAAPAEDEE